MAVLLPLVESLLFIIAIHCDPEVDIPIIFFCFPFTRAQMAGLNESTSVRSVVDVCRFTYPVGVLPSRRQRLTVRGFATRNNYCLQGFNESTERIHGTG